MLRANAQDLPATWNPSPVLGFLQMTVTHLVQESLYVL